MQDFYSLVICDLPRDRAPKAAELKRAIADAVEEIETQNFRCGAEWTPDQVAVMRRRVCLEPCS